ncbi:methyl-accepting chemotaxis protein [Pseudothauera rhizosphaerae]|uniref:Methyl-accepting chemotaxis protein n=1 Tax=Pseudothauera rhizosphaerae TaxID=2565932 RepID=A0A4S4AC61_9RHOO|nr:methyl-accepting chemotaxis protein [Pseudothauera rhizosphaerae]THF56552.1 methyl-accepting chemotaxis protein [Pseudothauera rhizosphaerae]
MKARSSVRTQLLFLVAITCGLFIAALAGSLWETRSSQQQLLDFIDTELATERDVTKAYAQGLQMGQALRNILLDPQNPQAYKNFDRAQSEFDAVIGRVKTRTDILKGGAASVATIDDIHRRWGPLQTDVIERVRAGDTQGARLVLIDKETPAWREMRTQLLDQIAHLESTSGEVKGEVVAGLERANLIAVVMALAALAACVGVSLYVIRDLFRQLGGEPSYAAEVARRIADGRLDESVEVRRGDRDSLLGAMSGMQEGLATTIADIRQLAGQVSESISVLRHNEAQIADASMQQSEAGSSIAAAVEEMTVSISQVSEHADDADRLTEEAAGQVHNGVKVINDAVGIIGQIAERMSASTQVMADLGASADGISNIVKVIQEVAEQTNLLALNAAIEAARAGEQGRGFAVVADEVRKLAERTAQSTHEITGMIQRVQASTHEAVRSMEDGRDLAERGADSAGVAREAVAALESGSDRVRDAVASINAALREQRSASTDIAQSIERIAQMSEQNHAATRDSLGRADDLQQLAASLEHSVGRFQLAR